MAANQSNQREKEIFERALDLESSEERLGYVKGACADDASLLARVRALLQAHDEASRFLPDAPGADLERTLAVHPSEEAAPGDRIGRYKLLQKIGEGGCGVVYMAEQEEPVRRRVALKVIKLGMDTKSVIARFEAERQALAMMDHPNIAKIFDAGVTGSNADFPVGEKASQASARGGDEAADRAGWKTGVTGRPYFVMELVRGIKITEYCDQANLPTRERLDLFIQVCHAIQHAHQKGIIHRDIKPSNILVTLHDGVAVPKVIDFGIAKATTDQRLTDKTLFTALEQFIGTPAYMSPEQAEMSGLDIDTRCDIYSLGVLLYEMLTGKTPFDAKELLASGLDEMRRTIREKEPVRPSTKLSQTLVGADVRRLKSKSEIRDPKSEAEIRASSRRLLQVRETIALLRGDLDWIVMKCLEKDRARRYETANGLALDIERHLSHQPVTARPPSTVYRAQKFVRRNKVMVTAAGLVASALVLGIAVSAWQAVRASRLRVRAEDNEQKALQAQAEEAKQRVAAVNAQTLAEEQRGLAQANELLARQHAYAADMKIADTACRENNLGQAMAALRRQIPRPGESDLRGIEWRYLWQKCQGQQLKTFRHEAEVTCADLSPDGRWLATVSGGSFWVWDTTREGERRALSSGAPRDTGLELGEHLAFDPQGRFLATAASSEVLIWNITDWRKLRSLPATNASLSFSGDGATLATFGWEGVQVWKAATWEPLVRPGEIKSKSQRSRQSFDAACRRIALNRDGSLLAESWQSTLRHESYADGEVALWQVPQRQLLFQWSEVKDGVGVAFSDDDHWLAACTLGPPAMVWLWSVREGKPVAQWLVSEGLGRTLAFAPGGHVLATAGTDQVIRLWETGQTNRSPRLFQGHLNDVCSLRFAADGPLVSASNDKTACLWNIGQGPSSPPAFSLPPERLICRPTADVRKMVTVNLTNLTFEEWDTESGQRLRQKRIQGADAILHHGTLFNGKPLTYGLLSRSILLDGDVQAGDSRVRHMGHPPGSRAWDLCANTGDGRVYAWNAESGDLVYSNKVASRLLGAIPVTDHKKLVLLEDYDRTLSSYDLQTHQTKLIAEHVPGNARALKVSPDGRLFSYVTTGQVKVWDVTTEQTKSIVKLPEWSSVVAVEFSPDSRWLAVATSGGWAQVWDVVAGRRVSDLAGYLAGTSKVSFSADSRSLVTYGEDGTAKIWNIATSREMVSGLPVNWFLIWHLEWGLLPQDGNSVVEGAGEQAIRVVRLPTLAEIDALENTQMKSP